MKTPVALIIFNRPDTTARVFAEIARAKPSQLLVVADGPRADRPEEEEKCAAARAVIAGVDWDCNVITNYSEVNLGCRRRVSSGLDWVFRNVEEAIILEDDCLPEPTFFLFCQELLERYRNDERVMAVSGDNFQFGQPRTPHSYYFSRYVTIWGWASWRRAWQYYDVGINLWPELRKTSMLADILIASPAVKYWQDTFDRVFAGEIDTWDFQWLFTCWAQSGLSIIPNVNLVSNIGFGATSTHTADDVSSIGNLPTSEMIFPLRHPPYIVRAAEADEFLFKIFAAQGGARSTGLYQRLRQKLSAKTAARGRKAISL